MRSRGCGLLTLDLENFEERYDEAIEQVRSGDTGAQAKAAAFLREIISRDAKFWQPHLMLALAVRESEGMPPPCPIFRMPCVCAQMTARFDT